jgi:hypothetical protein
MEADSERPIITDIYLGVVVAPAKLNGRDDLETVATWAPTAPRVRGFESGIRQDIRRLAQTSVAPPVTGSQHPRPAAWRRPRNDDEASPVQLAVVDISGRFSVASDNPRVMTEAESNWP